MTLHSTRPAPRLRCRKCFSTNIAATGRTRRGVKLHHIPDIEVTCDDCEHIWFSAARNAHTLLDAPLHVALNQLHLWDEMPSKKPLTRPPLPE